MIALLLVTCLGLALGAVLERDSPSPGVLVFRGAPLLFLAFACQAFARGRLVDVMGTGFQPVVIWVVACALVGVTLLRNGHLIGALVAVIGIGMNMLVVVANGGMPVPVQALSRAASAGAFASGFYLPVRSAVLPWLGDILTVSGASGSFDLISVGDLMIFFGVGLMAGALAINRRAHDVGSESNMDRSPSATRRCPQDNPWLEDHGSL